MKRATVLPPRHAALLAATAVLLLFGGFAALGSSSARSADRNTPAPGDEIPGLLVVGFAPSAGAAQERQAVQDSGAQIESRIKSIAAAVVSADPDQADRAAAEMQDTRAVDYVEPNYAVGSFRVP